MPTASSVTLGVAEREIQRKKIGGKPQRNVICGFRLIPAGEDNLDGSVYHKMEDDNGVIRYTAASGEDDIRDLPDAEAKQDQDDSDGGNDYAYDEEADDEE